LCRYFDVQKLERDIELDSVESDIPDDTVVEVPATSEVTYQVTEEKGTERGRQKLVTSDGYSFGMNRKFGQIVE
jgi:hypothetical protein